MLPALPGAPLVRVQPRLALAPFAARCNAGARLAARPGWEVPVLAARLADATCRLEEFQQGELARFRALSQETRAATNSYLAGAIESSETNEAGRRFRERKTQERSDEEGS